MNVFRDYCSMNVEVSISETETKTVTIDRNTRFFVNMVRRELCSLPFVGITYFGSGNNTEEWAECYINEDEYLIDMNNKECSPYKIKLTACEQAFGSKTFYWETFISLLKDGHILVKENEFQTVIPYRQIVPMPNSCAVIVEEGTTVVDIRDYI